MRIISFAWTSQALIDRKKSVTRRDWKDKYAKTFKAGEKIAAYDRNPRFKGKKIGEIILTKAPYKQWLHEVTDEEEIREGGLWGSGKAYQDAMGSDREVWVVEFKILWTIGDDIRYEHDVAEGKIRKYVNNVPL